MPPLEWRAGSLIDRFGDVVAAGADRPAVVAAERTWSFGELAALAGRAAAAIDARGAASDLPIALWLPTGAPLIGCALGALAAGRFYAPLDTRLGEQACAALANLAQPGLVITAAERRVAAERWVGGRRRLVLDVEELLEDERAPELPRMARGGDLAYLLFTSGSTGEAKGVLQSHRNVLHNVATLAAGLALGAADRLSLLPSASHGASVSDLFGALLYGAAVVPLDPTARSSGALAAWVAEQGITVWHSVPGLYRAMLRALASPAAVPDLRLVKLAGETVFRADLELFQQRLGEGVVFHTSLGMTERNVIRQWFADHGTRWPEPILPVGHAVDGTEVELRPAPGAEPTDDDGEIVVIAETLPVGYWRRPELTARSFAADERGPGLRRFATGDRGRLLPGGCLVHLGRLDEQVKVRGMKVDPRAVDAALMAIPRVAEAAVALRDGGRRGPELVAWVVTEDGPPLSVAALRRALAARLPAAAVPTRFELVPALPRTASGKVDRPALLAEPRRRPATGFPFLAPGSELEAEIARAIAEVLAVDEVGAGDDFFDLGGTSLSLLELLLELETRLRRPMTAEVVLGEPTAAGIARQLGGTSREPLVRLRGAPPSGAARPPLLVVPGHGGGEGPDALELRTLLGPALPATALWIARVAVLRRASPQSLVEAWVDAALREVPGGAWNVFAACAGGALGLALARRLAEHGSVRLVLHDALVPTWNRRLRSRWRLLREPWGDDLAARLRTHLERVVSLPPRAAVAYLRGRRRSLAAGLVAAKAPPLRRLVERRREYALLAAACAASSWSGDALLVVTPARQGQGLERGWAGLLPNLRTLATGPAVQAESQAAIREFLGG